VSRPATRLPVDDFYVADDLPPQQGDILLGAVARVIAKDSFSPARWAALDEALSPALGAQRVPGGRDIPAVHVAAGRALVMVTTHDYGLDKEFNARYEHLVATGVGRDRALADAESANELDRSFQVSPLIDPTAVTVDGRAVPPDQLLAGKVIGYLPVPELILDGIVVVPASVVDLGYRATIDRMSYAARVCCVSETARRQLRYAMARLDVLRTPTLETDLAQAVGQSITKARVSKRDPIVVEVTLADGSRLDLLAQPGSPPPGPVSRSARSARR